jgi:16S rRNA (cytosine967-C5)-methyltransferase
VSSASCSQSSLPPARSAALAALRAVLSRKNADQKPQDAQAALDMQIRAQGLSARDGALATELCYGYLRHRNRLLFCQHMFLRKPGKLPDQCKLAFGLAGYERLFLQRVPEYATRSWLTSLVRKQWGQPLARVATAFLARLAEHAQACHDPAFYRQDGPDEAAFVSRFYSLPPWIVRLWLDAYGMEPTLKLAQAQVHPADLGLRVNPLHDRAREIIAEYTPHREALRILDAYSLGCPRDRVAEIFPALNRDLDSGAMSRQSIAAQDVLLQLQARDWPAPVWDLCAGRGGKTCYLLERGQTHVLAADRHLGRLRGLSRELARLGLPAIPIIAARADQTLPVRPQGKQLPATILLDVPCSGLGVLASRPDIKWKRGPADLPALLQTQQRMLDHAAQVLRPGGHLVYITCTLNPTENQGQIQTFLADHPAFQHIARYVPSPALEPREFFWAAVLRKTSR